MTEIYGEPLNDSDSRMFRDASAGFMTAHFTRLAEYIDMLSEHTHETIEKLSISVHKGAGSQRERSINAATVFGWFGLFNPYNEHQGHFVAADRLLQEIHMDGTSLHTYAVFIIGATNPDLWRSIKTMNPALAEDFKKYSIMFAYQNLNNPEVIQHARFQVDAGQISPVAAEREVADEGV